MCAFFDISRASYYAWRQRCQQPDRDMPRMAMVQEAYQASHKTYGYRRIQIWIEQRRGIVINHKAVLRLMRRLAIRSVARKRKPSADPRAAGSIHTYANLLHRNFAADKPNQKWVTDITYIATVQGWAYLCTIKDLYDNFIVSHLLGRQASVQLVTHTLKQACQKQMVTDGLLLHSDQGQQYRSQAYFVLTQDYKLIPSMSRRANCWDNAPMENFFSHLKQEALRQSPRLSFEETSHLIDEYVYFFNYERIQLKTKQTPFQFRCLSG
jgi:putative transposase